MNTKKFRFPLFLLLVYVVYFLYYFADMQTSANTMVKQTESRGQVHLYLIVLIGLLAAYFLSRLKWRLDDGFRGCFFLMTVWCVFTDLLTRAEFWGIATHVGLLVLFYLAYYFGGHYIDSHYRYRLILFLEYLLWIITMYYAVMAYINFNEYNDGDRDSVLNMAYNILVFIPFLLQIKNKALKVTSVAISILYIIVSLKRGAIIACVAMMVVYFFLSSKGYRGISEGINFKRSMLILTSIIVFVVTAIIVDRKMDGALSGRFSLEALLDGSSRSDLYDAAWKDILSRSIVGIIIGSGSGSSLRIIGSGVHNELLEFLFSYGLIGLIMYVLTLIRGVFRIRKIYLINNEEEMLQGKVFAMGMAYMIVVGLFGTAVFSHMFFHIMLAMGIANSPEVQTCERESTT